jgi:hypothetical protein
VFALAVADHGREQHQALVLGQGQHLVDHLAHGAGLQRQVVGRAARRADAGEQQAQVIVNLGNRADGGARVMRSRLLLDRDRRRQALDMVDVGFFHYRQELARVGRQGLDITPLPLGLVARQRQVDILQIMGARTANCDGFHGQTISGVKPEIITFRKFFCPFQFLFTPIFLHS